MTIFETRIKVDLPDDQGWTVQRTKVNFTVEYSYLIKNLPIDAKQNPSQPTFKVETVYIIIHKVKHELTEDFHAELIEKYSKISVNKLPHVVLHIKGQIAIVEPIRPKQEIQGRRAATPNKCGRVPKSSTASAVSDSFSASAPLPTLASFSAQARMDASSNQTTAHMPPPPTRTTTTPATTAIPPAPATSFNKVSATKATRSAKHTAPKKDPQGEYERKLDERKQRGIDRTFTEVPDAEGADENAVRVSKCTGDSTDDEESDQEDGEEEELEQQETAMVEETDPPITQQDEEMVSAPTSTASLLSVSTEKAPSAVVELTLAAPATPPRPETPVLEMDTPIPATPILSAAPAPSATTTAANATPAGKTPGRSVSRSRSGQRSSSLFSPTKCMVAHLVGGKEDQFHSGRTYAEEVAVGNCGLHRTTGSMVLSKITRTALKPLQSTPSGRRGSTTTTTSAVGVYTTEEEAAFAKQMASSTKAKRNPDGRPSIGTIENQWEYMRSTYFNNDDEEIQWSMVSRNKGAYKYAHLKNERAEDRYFKSLCDIAAAEAKIESATTGPAAKLIAVLQKLGALKDDFLNVPNSVETNTKVTELMVRVKDLVENEDALQALSANCRVDVETILNDEATFHQLMQAGKDGKKIRSSMVRNIFKLTVGEEITNAKKDLARAQRISDEAVEYMEKWSRREKDANDYAETMRQQEQEWLDDNHLENLRALMDMRSFIPVNVTELSVPDIMALAKENYGLFSLDLATEIKQNKLLHWIVTHTDDIALDSFLTGDKKAIFENFEALDVRELRALAVVIPVKFENDKDGKKAEWRCRFFARVRQVVSQQNGELVKGAYDPAAGRRVMVAQKPLKPEQLRRPVYNYITKEKSALKVKQYNDRMAMLARREAALTQAEAAAVQAKGEYDIVLAEMRDPAFIAEYGNDKLAQAKEQAKAMLTSSNSALKSARLDLKNLQDTIKNMPVSRERYLELEAELCAFLVDSMGITWTDKGLEPQKIRGVFDTSAEIKKVEKAAAKFVSAEEEAAARRLEMEQIINRKPAFSTDAPVDTTADNETRGDIEPSTPAAGAVAEQSGENATMPAPCTEPRRLSVAALGIFSPSASRTRDSVCGATPGEGLEFTTPRKRNSVLANANPDMLNTLNKMLMSSPAATPLRMGRPSMFSAPSASKLALTASNNDAAGDVKKPEVKVTTRSQILMKLMNPQSSSAVSPKRNPLGALLGGGAPKLGFLAQLTARVGMKSAAVADCATAGGDENSTAAPASSVSGTTRSLFADIARFRKPDPEETAVVATGVAEDKENASENNLPTAVPSAAKATIPAAARPALSLFDEIRKRRVIE